MAWGRFLFVGVSSDRLESEGFLEASAGQHDPSADIDRLDASDLSLLAEDGVGLVAADSNHDRGLVDRDRVPVHFLYVIHRERTVLGVSRCVLWLAHIGIRKYVLTLGEVIASEIIRLRKERDWSQKELAARVSELGLPMIQTTVAKIEKGETRAANLSVADLMVLAAALDTSPVALVFPVGRVETVEVTPKLRIFSGLAAKWFCAMNPLTDENRYAINPGPWKQATIGFAAYREYDLRADDLMKADGRLRQAEFVGDERRIQRAKADYVRALNDLAGIYRAMDRNGITPPGERSAIWDAWKAIGVDPPKRWLWEEEETK